MDAVAKTSLLTAAMRAVETKRNENLGRLFKDPYAELLAGAVGMELLQKALAESGDQPAIAVRTAYMDTKIMDAVSLGVRQIVMLAAGMDTRAYRLPFPNGTNVYELDRKEVFDYKHEKLKQAPLLCQRQALAVDLRDDWPAELLQTDFKKGTTTLWLVEGLLMYLEEPEVIRLIEKINSISSRHDFLLFDVLTRNLLDAPYMKKQLDFLANMGAPWRFGVSEEPEIWMKKLGWQAKATQPGEFSPTRWPFPTAPRHLPNVPRGFYVEAYKL